MFTLSVYCINTIIPYNGSMSGFQYPISLSGLFVQRPYPVSYPLFLIPSFSFLVFLSICSHPLFPLTCFFSPVLKSKFPLAGVSTPRTRSVVGTPLPPERVVASTVLVDRDDPDQQFTLSVMQWAQFIDHDLTFTPFTRLCKEQIQCRV